MWSPGGFETYFEELSSAMNELPEDTPLSEKMDVVFSEVMPPLWEKYGLGSASE